MADDRRTVLVVDEAPLMRWEIYQGLEELGVPLEVLPRLAVALPRARRLRGGVMLVSGWDTHWGRPEGGLVAAIEEWLTVRGAGMDWRVMEWTAERRVVGAGPAVISFHPSFLQSTARELDEALRAATRLSRAHTSRHETSA